MSKNNPQSLSELGKHILATCPNAYVNDAGQVIDPCHVWWTDTQDISSWDIKPGDVKRELEPQMDKGWRFIGLDNWSHMFFNGCTAKFLKPNGDQIDVDVTLPFVPHGIGSVTPESVQKAYEQAKNG